MPSHNHSAFLLTHPVWDVTLFARAKQMAQGISTHTSRVGCDCVTKVCSVCYAISTHTSRVGCDQKGGCAMYRSMEFLLTHPVWDVTFALNGKIVIATFLLTHPVWDVTYMFTRMY